MRKMMMVVFLMCFIITGCTDDEIIVTSAQIKDSFESHGIQLSKQTKTNPESVFSRTYNHVSPERYLFDDKQSISIYIFTSSKEAKKGLKDFEDNTATADVVSHSKYQVANILLFHVADDAFEDERVKFVMEGLLVTK
ncbi:hypothetical protein [Cohnella abietis]|uniref:Lipoprotein n=1 Tax=Cohnella abietis TaxID=2507935 RepID=A0A3T1D674_9BACL|nr:hypothetical protein [Cohnella abietis]BBI33578.1 hypothetical protein KCTCHS21_29770 [Cohnella abietis]